MEFSEAAGDVDYVNDVLDNREDCSPKTFIEFPSATKPQKSGLHRFADYGLKNDTYQMLMEDPYEFPAHLMRKETKKIKDVVKEHVLPFLPAKSLMRCKAVSKEWDTWIASPFLGHQQSFSYQSFSGYFYQDTKLERDPKFLSLDHSKSGVPSPGLHFLPEMVKILSSSSGLLLCQGYERYYVCNPATRDWKVLPFPQYYHGAEPAVVLAFEPSLRNIEAYYHVICAFPMLDQPLIIGFEIYSSESNSWRCCSADCTELENTSLAGGGMYMKGVAYYKTTSNEVLAFHVKEEIPAIIALPQVESHGSLTQMDGELCYITANNECGNVFLIDIYEGMEMSLKRSFSINLGPHWSFTQACEVLPCVNSNAVAIHIGRYIYFYHPREHKIESMMSPGAIGHGIRFLPYINSLVMLHDLKSLIP